MPAWNGKTPTPEEMARMMRDALNRNGGEWQFTPDPRTANLGNRNNAINLIRCSDGVYRPERKRTRGFWNNPIIRTDGGIS